MKKTLFSLAVAALAATSSFAGDPAAGVIFTGFEGREEAWYSHVGLMHDLGGDLGTSGLYVRGFGGYGGYDYLSGGNRVHGSIFDADLSLGYRAVLGDFVLGAFAGLHVRDRDEDVLIPGNNIDGTDWGARFGVDATGNFGPAYVSFLGQYSTVEESFWGRGRVGYDFGAVKIGPEVVYLNDAQFDEVRYGGFFLWQITPVANITLSAGAAHFDSRQGSDGAGGYGSFALSFVY